MPSSLRILATLVFVGLGCGLAGCGNAPTTIPAPVVAPGDPDKAAAPAPSAASRTPPSKATPKSAATSSASKFPKESPDDVFVAVGEGPNQQVAGPATRFSDGDRFTVATGLAGGNSTLMAVAAVPDVTGSPRADFQLPEGFLAVASYGYTADGYPRRIRCEKDGSLMAFVPAGIARIGVSDGPKEAGPEFTVFVDAFYMDVTELTLKQYNDYRDTLREQKKRPPTPPLNETAGGGQPALGIPWGDAKNYCRWAGKDLPTEAEFEKAGRGSDAFRAPWGNGRPVWSRPRTPGAITVVGAFAADVSPFGICDLAGNAREWVEDYFVPHHNEAVQASTVRTLTNWGGPKKATSGTQRVLKGNGADWSLWHRTGTEMSQRLPDVGFRGVLRIAPPDSPSGSKKSST
jgi:sulfatase modifying factor 1